MTRLEGERVRIKHSLARAHVVLDGVEQALLFGNVPFGTEVAQAVMNVALEIAMQIAKHDTIILVAEEESST